MGTKRKATKKSKSKSKKTSQPPKHVEIAPQENSKPSENEHEETTSNDDEHGSDEMECVEEAAVDSPVAEVVEAVSEESNGIEKLDEPEKQQLESLEEKAPIEHSKKEGKPKLGSMCHSRITKLRNEEGGGRTFQRKMSLQVEKPPRQQDTARRMSFAEIKLAKHPLNDNWTFWYYMGNKYKQWSENLKRVCELDFVEDFWCLYNELINPSRLSPGRDFSYFKEHIRPEWEDPANIRGGLWSVCPRERQHKSLDMDRAWLEILMFMIGDQFGQHSVHVNGVSYSKRKLQDRISLWIGLDISRHAEILEIGRSMKCALSNASNSFKLEYATSEDWKQKTGSTVSVRFTL